MGRPLSIKKLKAENIPKVLEIITEAFHQSYILEFPNIPNFQQILDEEIIHQQKRLESFQKSGEPSFLVAKYEGKIVGTIAYGKPEDTMLEGVKRLNPGNKAIPSLVEIKSLYVKPTLQRQGVGSALLQELFKEIHKTSHTHIAAFTGFSSGKAFWEKHFGEAAVVLEQYDGEETLWVWIKEI